jgi:hypothetical protein
MNKKKGQTSSTSSAFTLVLFIMAFLILYIVLLPDADRNWLLHGNETSSVNYVDGKSENIILSLDNIQLSPDIDDDEFKITLESFELYTTVQSKEYLKINPIHVTRSIIFNNKKIISFDINNYDDLKNLELHFKAEKAMGRLKIKVNDYLISEIDSNEFSSYKDLRTPIVINKNIIKPVGNTITFELTSPGIFFWRVNIFDLNQVSLFEKKEIYNQDAMLTFDFSKSELSNLEKASLNYQVIVTNPSNVDIYLNNRVIFSGEPTIQGESKHKLLVSDLKEHNTLTFMSKKGSYNFFDISVEGDYKQSAERKHYFNVGTKKSKYVMTFDLMDTVNSKRFNFYINDDPFFVDTREDILDLDITGAIETGRNTIMFAPTSDVAISNIKITEQ